MVLFFVSQCHRQSTNALGIAVKIKIGLQSQNTRINLKSLPLGTALCPLRIRYKLQFESPQVEYMHCDLL